MKDLFIAWQDPDTRSWMPVGRLHQEGSTYHFSYTYGANASPNFTPFGRMTELNAVYVSEEMFPLFANRILAKKRPEYGSYLRWLGFEGEDVSDLELLGRSGGTRATDNLEIFPCPAPETDGSYLTYFFSHGLAYLTPENQKQIASLNVGENLYLMLDLQNKFDKHALLMRTYDPMSIVGYCPRYLSPEFMRLVKADGNSVRVTVHQVNADAPSELRLLCKLTANWPEGFVPCDDEMYKPLIEIPRAFLERSSRLAGSSEASIET